jgi:hypothetical protein
VNIETARLKIDRQRLELDKSKAEREKRFWNKNSTSITALVSLAAVIVSLSQVWVAKISKDKELEITSLQKLAELDVADKQKEKELAILTEQRHREWSLNAAKFVTDNRKALFAGTPQERDLFAKLIPTVFPADVSASLLDRLIAASPPTAKGVWSTARANVIGTASLTEFSEYSESINWDSTEVRIRTVDPSGKDIPGYLISYIPFLDDTNPRFTPKQAPTPTPTTVTLVLNGNYVLRAWKPGHAAEIVKETVSIRERNYAVSLVVPKEG